MDSITLENFRCFRERQTARLAPLTLLVGENSTGKTSFMAMIRALWDVAYTQRIPDFKEDPYDLGSFAEIAHHRNAREHTKDFFSAGFESTIRPRNNKQVAPLYFETTFGKSGTISIPIKRYFSQENTSIEENFENNLFHIILKTNRGEWQHELQRGFPRKLDLGLEMEDRLFSLNFYLRRLFRDEPDELIVEPISNSPDLTKEDIKRLKQLINKIPGFPPIPYSRMRKPFASAPARSKPQRTYDPSRPIRDSEGDYVPMYLAYLDSQHKEAWKELQGKLESFGSDAGLFNQISIKQLGTSVGSPFQIQIRKFSKKRKGPQRNLVDVGYGVSQVLPLITELFRTDAPKMFLVQQPEVHLHPSAQAALGSLFCQVAGKNRQLIIETHSDYIIDRVRIDIRDESSSLKPEDVSILFFEPRDLDVRIHSLTFDEEGNVLGTPPGYRQFFMEEVRRSIGL